jgi:hypothetical protein
MEAKGTTLSKELGLQKLNEAPDDTTAADPITKKEKKATVVEDQPDKVETESGHWFSKWGRLKNTLNKQGKKMQEQLNKKIIAKYLPKMVQSELQIAQEITNALEQKKQPDEIKQIVANKRAQIGVIQKDQVGILSKAIDGMLTNTGKRLDAKIEASKLSDKNKLDLKNYWLLLKSQIHMNALFFMQQTISAKVKEALNGNEQAEKLLDETDDSSFLNVTAEQQKKDVNKRAAEIKKREEEIKTEKPEGAAEDKYAPGKKFTYKNTEGKDEEVTVKKIKEDGSLLITKTSDGKDYTFKKENFDKLVPVEEKEPVTTGEGEQDKDVTA